MVNIPSISAARVRCQALAALDLILSPEWAYRYYSFNARWDPRRQMASMRNGCGDEWFCLFDPAGWAAIKGLAHESDAWANGGRKLSMALRELVPPSLAEFSNEPAFRWDATTFAFYSLADSLPWVSIIEKTEFKESATGADELLSLLAGPPSAYVQYASDYFERDIDERLVAAVYALSPITDEIISALNPSLKRSEISNELFIEIGYPDPE